MASPSYPSAGAGTPGTTSAVQVLVMHCLKEDSIEGREGYSLRAASPCDPTMLRWVAALRHYELPLDMRSGSLLPNQTPRRLALLPGPDSRATLFQSSYLPEDTCQRPHSFVTHALIYPRLDALSAVAAWGAPDWQISEYPRGETKTLPPFAGVPQGGLVSEATLQVFLSGGDSGADSNQGLAQVVFPSRVERDPEQRRRWIRAALHFHIRTFEQAGGRGRVYVLAEPGAVALVVFAAARLLPPRLTTDLTFTTYEPPHSTLRGNAARIVGSYARNGFDQSESNRLRGDGYVVDTFRDSYGPEPVIDASWPLEELLSLAGRGDWTGVDEVRTLWQGDGRVVAGVRVEVLAEALRSREDVAALRAGTVTLPRLLALLRTRFGSDLLRDPQLGARAWAVIRPSWNAPQVRQERHLDPFLAEHASELLAELRGRAAKEPPDAWRSEWSALRALMPPDRFALEAQAVLQAWAGSAQADRAAAEVRAELLRDWFEAAGRTASIPSTFVPLLVPADEAAFRALIKTPALPPRVAGIALVQALAGSARWTAGPTLLGKDLPDDRFAACLTELARANANVRDAALKRLFPDGDTSGGAAVLLARALQSQADLPPAFLECLLTASKCDTHKWHAFWLEPGALEVLARRLKPGSEGAQRIWAGLARRFTPDNFDDEAQSKDLSVLMPACQKHGALMTADDRARLEGWGTLNAHFVSPSPASAAPALARACDAVKASREALAESWYRRRVAKAGSETEAEASASHLAQILLGLHGTEESACAAGLNLAAQAAAPAGVREAIFETIANDLNHNRLYDANRERLEGTRIYRKSTTAAASKPRGRAGRAATAAADHVKVGPIMVPRSAMDKALFAFFGFMSCTALVIVLVFLQVLDNKKNSATPPTAKTETPPSPPPAPAPAAEKSVDPRALEKALRENVALNDDLRKANAQKGETQSALDKLQKDYDSARKKYELIDRHFTEAQNAAEAAEATARNRAAAEKKKAEEEAARAAAAKPEPPKVDAARQMAVDAAQSAYLDVPIDWPSANKGDGKWEAQDRSDFVFLRAKSSTTPGRSFLATLRYFPGTTGFSRDFCFYSFDIPEAGKLTWDYQARDQDKKVEKLAAVTDLDQNVLLFCTSDYVYRQRVMKNWTDDAKGNGKKSTPTDFKDKRTPLKQSEGLFRIVMAVDGGQNFAIATRKPPDPADSGASGAGPASRKVLDIVELWDATNSKAALFKFDLSKYDNLFAGGPNAIVRSMGFDSKHERLIVNYEDQPHLVSLPLAMTNPLIPMGEPLRQDEPVVALDFDAPRTTLLTLDRKNRINTWDMSGSDPKLDSLQNQPTSVPNTTCLALSRDQPGLMAVGDKQGKVTIFEYPTTVDQPNGAPFRKLVDLDVRLKSAEEWGPIQKLQFSADGRVLAALRVRAKDEATPRTGVIRLWPCEKLRALAKLK